MNWVTGHLALGSRAEAQTDSLLRDGEITCILCLEPVTLVYPAIEGLVVACHGFLDGDELPYDTFVNGLRQLQAWVRDNRKVLIHCGAGVSRTATIAISYLAWAHAMPWTDAEQHVRTHHQIAQPHPDLVTQAQAHLVRLARVQR